MANSDETLEILIQLGVVGREDVEAAQRLIKESGTAASETGKEAQKLGEAHEEAAKHAEHSGLSHHALHQILHLISHESGPGVGAAMAGIAAASQGSMLIAIMAVKGLFEWLERVKKAAEEAAQVKAQAWINQQAAIQAAATSAEDFAKGLDHAKTATAQLEQQFGTEQAVLEAQIEGHKKLLEAIEREQLAAANGNKEKESEVKERFADLKREYDITSELLKLDKERAQLAKLNAAQGTLEKAADAAEASKEAALKNKGAAALKARVDSQDEKKLKQAYDEAVERIEQSASGPTVEAARAEAESRMGEDEDVQAFLAYQNDVNALKAHEETVKRLTKAAEKAIKARDENTDAIQKQGEQIDRDTAVSNQHQTDFRQERAIDDVRRLGGEKEIPGLVGTVVGNVQALQHGQKLSAQQLETDRVLTQLMSDLGYSGQATLRILNALAQDQAQTKQQLKNFEREMGGAVSRLNRRQ